MLWPIYHNFPSVTRVRLVDYMSQRQSQHKNKNKQKMQKKTYFEQDARLYSNTSDKRMA